MTRNVWALGALLMTVGCGTVAWAPSSLEGTPPGGRSGHRLAEAQGAPEIVSVAQPALAAFGAGLQRSVRYYWIGYTAADLGMEGLSDTDAGDGFGFGVGLQFSEASRVFYELAFEKTVNHEFLFPDVLTDSQTGYHQRLLVGVRSGAVAAARAERQPSPYVSAGLSSTRFRIVRQTSDFKTSGLGFYAGLGVEFLYSDRSSFSFDAKYHVWDDDESRFGAVPPATIGEGPFATVAFSILWLNRF